MSSGFGRAVGTRWCFSARARRTGRSFDFSGWSRRLPLLSLLRIGEILDRFGVLILRSLRRRTGLRIEPQWMDARTFERCRDAGIPASHRRARRDSIGLLSAATDDDVCNDLLRTIRNAGRWVRTRNRCRARPRCPNVTLYPKPVQEPMPIWIGAHAREAIRARRAQWYHLAGCASRNPYPG